MDLFFTNVAYASVDSFVKNVNSLIVNPIIELLFALALAFFIYGVLEFVLNQESEDKRTIGKRHMLWGLVGMTIMLGVWGILQVALDTLGITGIDPEEGKVELAPYNPKYNLGN